MPNGLATPITRAAGGITGAPIGTPAPASTPDLFRAPFSPSGGAAAGVAGGGLAGLFGGLKPKGGWGQVIGAGLGGLGGLLGGMLGGDTYGDLAGGLEDVQKRLEEYRQRGVGYYQPFQQAGVGAIPQYQAALQQMQDPAAYVSKLMETYHGSPEAHQQMTEMMKASHAGASAAGMLGSGAEQTALQKQAQQITAADQQRYLQNLMGVGQQYRGGLAGLMGGGLQAAGGMGGLEATFGKEIADYMAQQQAALAKGQQSEAGGLGQLLGSAATIASMF